MQCYALAPHSELIKALIDSYRQAIDVEVEVVVFRAVVDKEELFDHLRVADVIVGGYTLQVPITKEMRKVKLIAQPSTGFNHIDIDACAEKSILVANIGGANAVRAMLKSDRSYVADLIISREASTT